jgi:hypothetical protein
MKYLLQITVVVLFALTTSCKKEKQSIDNENQKIEISSTPEEQVANAITTTTSISSISGGSASVYFQNGQWSGNAPQCLSYSNQYQGYYVINTEDAANSLNYWTINGTNFGTLSGTVTCSSAAIALTIISWTNTSIKIRPSASYQLDFKTGVKISVTPKNSEVSANKTINVLGMLQNGRGYGQCTWEAAYQRKLAGLSIPPTAYTTSGTVNKNYVPQKNDVLHWGTGHTGIIISIPLKVVVGSGVSAISTYTFSLRERNYDCQESGITTSKIFKVSSTQMMTGIASAASALGSATTYWR